jgi:peptide-methionine (S)-S-oxide reductase
MMKQRDFDRKKGVPLWSTVSIAGVVGAGILAGCAAKLAATGQHSGMQAAPKPGPGQQEATLSGGCFWAMEAMFSRLKGVEDVEPGYSGGRTANPSYEEVCSGLTGHAETIDVIFDPKVISYNQLMTVFFSIHDPTTLNRQGDDEGTNYRSIVFYHDASQKAAAENAIHAYEQSHPGSHVVTEVTPFKTFYVAEAYHHHYFAQHPDEPYCQAVVAPKVAKFETHFKPLLK